MTICVAVKVNDCLVFASDSASSLTATDANGNQIVHNVYRHGNKVFNLLRGKPVCAMTCGMGNLGAQSISTIAKEFRYLVKTNDIGPIDEDAYTIEEITHAARTYFFDDIFKNLQVQPAPPHSLEFYVGGYSSGGTHPEIWRFVIQNGACAPIQLIAGPDDCGVYWSGQPEALNRLVLGYGQKFSSVLLQAGMPQAQIDALMQAIANDPARQIVSPAMPTQDAVELADYCVEMTKGYVRFLPGADVVGGDTDIATVSKHEGFKWVRRKHYYPIELNRLETDHV